MVMRAGKRVTVSGSRGREVLVRRGRQLHRPGLDHLLDKMPGAILAAVVVVVGARPLNTRCGRRCYRCSRRTRRWPRRCLPRHGWALARGASVSDEAAIASAMRAAIATVSVRRPVWMDSTRVLARNMTPPFSLDGRCMSHCRSARPPRVDPLGVVSSPPRRRPLSQWHAVKRRPRRQPPTSARPRRPTDRRDGHSVPRTRIGRRLPDAHRRAPPAPKLSEAQARVPKTRSEPSSSSVPS